ncbi:hypothetical protein L6452_37635 [Arctium lappa]|uniref:Uncharacterized protein n=1 Tax=Arctium lappa TaxID=4217 RepID=A0ACB8Y3I2_ARCLA|nr:hypothetical protein L6452_37635 [Arctium lappa]
MTERFFSRLLLVLSIATAFSDQSGCDNVVLDDTGNLHRSESPAVPESHSELPPVQSIYDVRIDGEDQSHQSSTNWLLELYQELEKQGVILP